MVTKTHLSCSINGLVREINNTKSIKKKNEIALSFLSDPKPFPDAYVQLLMELGKLKEKGWDAFTSSDCDNIKKNGSCGGHPVES